MLEVPTEETDDVERSVRDMEAMEWRSVGSTECWSSKRAVGLEKTVARCDCKVGGVEERDTALASRQPTKPACPNQFTI